jgi:hypothetical protein
MRAPIASSIVAATFVVGCYDFSKFDQASSPPPSDTGTADTFEAGPPDTGSPQDTRGIGDVAAWPDAAGLCREFDDDTKKRSYVICTPDPGTTPFNLARTYCTSHGLDLAFIDDDATQTFVFAALASMPGGTGVKAWIGLKFQPGDAGADGAYWLNHEPITYTNWNTPGDPTDNGTAWEDNCGEIFGGDGLWRDYYCTYGSYWFICGPP